MAARPLRHRLLGNSVVRTVLSLWSWFVLGVVIIVWVPLVAVVWLVTAPFDKGRYAAGLPVPQAHRRAPVAQSVVDGSARPA